MRANPIFHVFMLAVIRILVEIITLIMEFEARLQEAMNGIQALSLSRERKREMDENAQSIKAHFN